MAGTTHHGPSLGAAVARALLVLLLVLLLGLLAGGWYFADQLTAAAAVRPFEPDTEVVAADPDSITLRATDDLATGGRFGLELPDDAYASLGAPVATTGGDTTYEVVSYDGEVPSAGTEARVDEYWRVGDPTSVGLRFEDVELEGPSGPLPAWWVASGDTGTVVYVHGRGATREESLRFLEGIARAGWSTLVVTYRGGEGAPTPEGDRVRYGTDAWADVDVAVDWVTDGLGVERPIVLFGASMGGAVVAQQQARGRFADLVDGVVLDSPVLSLDALLDLQAGRKGIPEFVEPVLLPITEVWADVLHDLDGASLERTGTDAFEVPTLVFHGPDDDFVPFEPSLRLAEDEDVRYVGIDGARHVRSWNVDSTRYEAELTTFLGSLQ